MRRRIEAIATHAKPGDDIELAGNRYRIIELSRIGYYSRDCNSRSDTLIAMTVCSVRDNVPYIDSPHLVGVENTRKVVLHIEVPDKPAT